MVLYNKYRPKKFSDFFGQTNLINLLRGSIKEKTFVHSYIFSGSHGTGKTSMSRVFCKALCCTNFTDDICLKCPSCNLIETGNCVDVLEIDAASHNGVEFVRSLVETSRYLPVELTKKIVVIDEAHMLSTQSWNALLKIVEEPPSYLFFIFLTTNVKKIIPTIVSRCRQLSFAPISSIDLEQIFRDICSKEKLTLDEEEIRCFVKKAKGSARDLISFINPLSELGSSSSEKFNHILDTDLSDFLSDITEASCHQCLMKITDISNRGILVVDFFESLFSLLIDCLLLTRGGDRNGCRNELKLVQQSMELKLNWRAMCLFLMNNIGLFSSLGNTQDLARFFVIELSSISQETSASSEQQSFRDGGFFKSTNLFFSPMVEKVQNEIVPTRKEKPRAVIEQRVISSDSSAFRDQVFYALNNSDPLEGRADRDLLRVEIDEKVGPIYQLFKDSLQEYWFISSSCSIIVVFGEKAHLEAFLQGISKPDNRESLSRKLQKRVFWIALLQSELSRYLNDPELLRKKGRLKKHQVFPDLIQDEYQKTLKRLSI